MTTADAAHDAARAALAQARLGAPGGDDHLAVLVREQARRYAAAVLCLPDAAVAPVVDASVARALRTLTRDVGPEELPDHVHLAVREEAFRRQPGAAGRTTRRVLAAAALVLVVLAMGAVALVAGGALEDDPAPDAIASVGAPTTRTVEGRVVDTSPAGTVLGGRPGIDVVLVADGETVGATRTDDAGRFSVEGLDPGTYEVRVGVPVGLRVRGARDGRSIVVDTSDAPRTRLVLQLQRA